MLPQGKDNAFFRNPHFDTDKPTRSAADQPIVRRSNSRSRAAETGLLR